MNTLAVRESEVSMELFNQLREQARELIKTGFLPPHLKTPEQAVAVALIGRELDIPMMLSLRKIYVIQGTPALASELMLALAQRTGQLEDLRIADDGQVCTVTIKRKDRQSPVTTAFGMADAEAMGLAVKDNWRKQAPVMRRWRAISANLRLSFGDATGGLYTLEELAPDVRVDAQGTPVGPVVEPAALESLMPRRKGDESSALPIAKVIPDASEGIAEGPPSTVQLIQPKETPTPSDSDRDILEAMFGPEPIISDGTVPAEVVQPSLPMPPPVAEPAPVAPGQLRFEINGKPVTTNGATKDQMMKSYKLGALVDELVGKGTAKEILGREAGCEHRHELTEAGARIYIAALSKAINAAEKRR